LRSADGAPDLVARQGPASKEVAMPVQKLKEFLDREGVKYVSIHHSQAFTAQEVAASAHVSGVEMAKTVVVRLDGRTALAVLPASQWVDFAALKACTGAGEARLASEQEFRDMFPDCELGAMPPFGNLYGLEVYVAKRLAEDEEIAFNACSHTELIRLAYRDFERLAKPRVMEFAHRP
jgi:Ala-tRNA(Pro) deacylase